MRRIVAERAPLPGESVELDPVASHHLLHVIRLARGEQVRVVDGHGNAAVAALDGVTAGRAILIGVTTIASERSPTRVVLLGLPRGPLLDEALTLGTEAGATRFVLARCRRSPPGEARLDRLQRVLRAAVTQCGRAELPELAAPLPFADALHAVVDQEPEAARWRCDAHGAAVVAPAGACVLAVGPEGGFDPAECAAMDAVGFAPVGLGPHVLRTPTAVAAGLSRAFTSRW